MKVWLKTIGKADIKPGSRVRICGLVYIVTDADTPTELDDEVAVTECDVQPGDSGGKSVINAELVVSRRDHVQV